MSRCLPVLVLILMSGCAHVRIHRTSLPSPSIGAAKQSTYKIAFLGLKSFTDPIDLSKDCESSWETLDTRVTFLQGVLRVVTVDMYSPFSVEVACSAPRAAPKEEF